MSWQDERVEKLERHVARLHLDLDNYLTDFERVSAKRDERIFDAANAWLISVVPTLLVGFGVYKMLDYFDASGWLIGAAVGIIGTIVWMFAAGWIGELVEKDKSALPKLPNWSESSRSRFEDE